MKKEKIYLSFRLNSLKKFPAPNVNSQKAFSMLSTLLDSDPFLGRCLIGR